MNNFEQEVCVRRMCTTAT